VDLSSNLTLSGTTHTAAGTYNGDTWSFSGNTNYTPDSGTVTDTINQAPAITSSNGTTFTVGSAGSFTVTTTGFPVSTLSASGTLPTGVTFTDNGDDTATLAGTPAAGTGGTCTLTLSAGNGVGSTATQTFTLTVDQAPAITSSNAATFTVGSAGSFTMTTTGFPISTLSKSGSLPAGVSFTDNGDDTATLAGTPAAGTGGTYTLTLSAGNGVGSAANQTFTLTVNQAPAITSSNATTFTVGSSGSFTMTTTGFPNSTLSESGSLPSGFTFTDNGDDTATLAGAPAAGTGGTYTLTLSAGNGVGSTATQTFTLTVDQAPAITSSNAATFTVGSAGSFTVTTTGFPTATISASDDMAGGLSFTDNGDGTATLSGTPDQGTGGIYDFRITASNGVASDATQDFVVTVDEPPGINSGDDPTFTAGSAGTFLMTTTGYPASAFSESGTLPTGVTLQDNGDGTATLGGIPAAGTGGTYAFNITASNGIGSPASQSYTLTVDEAPGITSNPGTTFTTGSAGSFTVTTSGYPVSDFLAGGILPDGVDFTDNGDGTATLAGTPAGGTGGTYTLTVSAYNGVGSPATQTFLLTIDQAPPFTSNGATTFTAGSSGSFTVATSGYPAASLSENGTLPNGVSLTSNGDGTATLAGTPAAGTGGIYDFTITASNGVGSTVSQSFVLTIDQAPALTSGSSATFSIGAAANFTVTTTGYPNPFLSAAGFLPAGISFTDNGDSTATVSGTPAAGSGGSYSLALSAANGVGNHAGQTFVITINQALAITSSNAVTFQAGSAGTFQVTTTGYPVGSLTESGSLPGGVTFQDNGNGTATLSGTPSSGSGASFPITITDSNGVTTPVTQSFVLSIDQPAAILSNSATTLTVGSPGTFMVTTSGYPAPVLTMTGTLPGGLSFLNNGNGTGTLSGTPHAGSNGIFDLGITATNGLGSPVYQSFVLTVVEAPAITSNAAATFTVGTPGTFTVTTSGYPLATSMAESGSLPNGINFHNNNNGTATLSGTPSAGSGGPYTITFTATNSAGSSANQSFVLTVDEAPAITSSNATTFTVGSSGSFSISATGYPVPAVNVGGSLPNGVSITTSNGTTTLSGSPAAGSGGSYNLVINADNGIGSPFTQAFVLTVDEAPVITSGSAAAFTAGSSGTFTVNTSGYPAPTISESGGLPSGISFHNNSEGTASLSGTPVSGMGGTYTLSITADNGIGAPATQTLVVTVWEAPGFTSGTGTAFTSGTYGSFSVTTTGYPAAVISESGALPSGIGFSSSNGTATLSGTPAAGSGGTYDLTFSADNGVGNPVTQSFVLNVQDAPAITSLSSTTFTVDSAGTFTVTATGFPNATLTESGDLPDGLSFTGGNGLATLSGTPQPGTSGTYNLTFLAADGLGNTASQSFVLTINDVPATSDTGTSSYIYSSSAATFTAGSLNVFQVATTGDPTSSISESGTLPSGLSFSDNGDGTATLSGTPQPGTGGSYDLVLSAFNGVGSVATQDFDLTIDEAPAITSPGQTTFTAGTYGSFAVTTTGYPTANLSESGTLPSGVGFQGYNNGTASLYGAPAGGSGGIYNFTITANNGTGVSATQNFVLTVDESPGITSVSSTTFTAGSLGTFSVATSGYPAPTLTESGALPNGVSFNSTASGAASLSGTPRAGSGGTYTLSLTANNGVGSPYTQTFVLTVNEAPAITSSGNTTFTVGSPGTFTVTTFGYPVDTLSASGAWPSGVSFTDNHNGTATLAGTPNAGSGATYYLSLTAFNGIGSTASQTFVLTVDEAPAITSSNTTTFGVGSFGSFTVTTTGYPAPTLSESGALPAGVSFSNHNDGTATLSGMPQPGTAGIYDLTFTAHNGVPSPASQSFTLIVADAPADNGDPGPNGNEDPPVAEPDAYTVAAGNTLYIPASGVLANDSDPAGGGLTAQLVAGPSYGTLTLNSDGSFSYTPQVNFVGTDQFVYLAEDGPLVGSSATVTITVTGSLPVANDDYYQTWVGHTLSESAAAGVLANDSGQSIQALLVSPTSHGAVSLASNGSFVYVPDAGYVGPDDFLYTDSSNGLQATPAEVHIDVGIVVVINNGTGNVQVTWSGGGPQALAPNTYYVIDSAVNEVNIELEDNAATYSLATNTGIGTLTAASGVTDVNVTADTGVNTSFQDLVGDGHIRLITLPAGSILSAYDRGDLGTITGPSSVGSLTETEANDLVFANLNGGITGLDHISNLQASGWLNGNVSVCAGIDNLAAYGIGGDVEGDLDQNLADPVSNAVVGAGGITGTLSLGLTNNVTVNGDVALAVFLALQGTFLQPVGNTAKLVLDGGAPIALGGQIVTNGNLNAAILGTATLTTITAADDLTLQANQSLTVTKDIFGGNIKKVEVKGDLTLQGKVTSFGDIGNITVGGSLKATSIDAQKGDISSISTVGDLVSRVTTPMGNITSITVGGNFWFPLGVTDRTTALVLAGENIGDIKVQQNIGKQNQVAPAAFGNITGSSIKSVVSAKGDINTSVVSTGGDIGLVEAQTGTMRGTIKANMGNVVKVHMGTNMEGDILATRDNTDGVKFSTGNIGTVEVDFLTGSIKADTTIQSITFLNQDPANKGRQLNPLIQAESGGNLTGAQGVLTLITKNNAFTGRVVFTYGTAATPFAQRVIFVAPVVPVLHYTCQNVTFTQGQPNPNVDKTEILRGPFSLEGTINVLFLQYDATGRNGILDLNLSKGFRLTLANTNNPARKWIPDDKTGGP